MTETTPTPPVQDAGLRCPSDCDADCEVPCHEEHAVPWKRHHDPAECSGTLRQRIETALRSLNPDGGTLVDLDDDNDVTVVATAVLPMLVAERNTARAAELRAWADRLDTRPDWTLADIATLMRGRADALDAGTGGPVPRRGDAVEAWLKAQRDRYDRHGESSEFWHEFDRALDDYRLHADTGTPLGEHACDGPHCDHDDSAGATRQDGDQP